MKKLMLSLILVVVALVFTGCTPQRIKSLRKEVTNVKQDMNFAERNLITIREELSKLPDGAKKDSLLALETKFTYYLKTSATWVDQAEKTLIALDAGQNPWDVAESTITGITKLIPPPYNIIGMGALAALGFARAYQNRKAAKSIVLSVNPIVKKNPSKLESISDAQTISAKRIVDEVQGKKFSLPI